MAIETGTKKLSIFGGPEKFELMVALFGEGEPTEVIFSLPNERKNILPYTAVISSVSRVLSSSKEVEWLITGKITPKKGQNWKGPTSFSGRYSTLRHYGELEFKE